MEQTSISNLNSTNLITSNENATASTSSYDFLRENDVSLEKIHSQLTDKGTSSYDFLQDDGISVENTQLPLTDSVENFQNSAESNFNNEQIDGTSYYDFYQEKSVPSENEPTILMESKNLPSYIKNYNFEIFDKNEIGFLTELKNWALRFKISIIALTMLLFIINKYAQLKLPKDGRTVLKTPRTTPLIPMESGQYYHYGLNKIVKRIVSERKI